VANFNPVRQREIYLANDKNLVRYDLSTEYDPDSPIGNIAISKLNNAISGFLVGLGSELAPIIPLSADWISKAIEKNEQFGPNHEFHIHRLFQSLALSIWMRDGTNAVKDWDASRLALKASLAQGNGYSRAAMATDYLDLYLSLCYQAEQYEDGIAEYEKYHGTKEVSLKKATPPRKLAYAMCLHKARGQFEVEDLFSAGRKTLQAYLQEAWLGKAQFRNAAIWLKIVYWHHTPALTPLRTILSAYDNMPDVQRPDFV